MPIGKKPAPGDQGRFQTFTQGGANWRAKRAENFWPPPGIFWHPPAGGGELAQGGAKEETKYL